MVQGGMNMAYRMVYLRIQTYAYGSDWSSEADEAAFDEECRRLFQQLGWTLHAGFDGVCDTVTKDRQDLYLHPTSFSGVMDESNIQPLQEQLSEARTFRCYAVDCYEEYTDLSDEEYRAALETRREEITAPIASYFAQIFEICRLCDKDRRNAVGNHFMFELIEQLLQEGRLVAAETPYGMGIRSATARELKDYHKPAEQIEGQITMMF